MASPLSVGDIAAIIQTVIKIKDLLSTSNRATVRYKQLQSCILSFERQLGSFTECLREPLVQDIAFHNRFEHFLELCRTDLERIQQTLSDCEDFLREYDRMRRQRSSVVETFDTFMWHLLPGESTAKELRDRIQRHSETIGRHVNFITLGIQLINVQGPSPQAIEKTTTTTLPPLPQGLRNQFGQSLVLPQTSVQNIHLSQLLNLGSKCLEEARSVPQSTPIQRYLSILKAQWLLEKVRESESFNQESPLSQNQQLAWQLENNLSQSYMKDEENFSEVLPEELLEQFDQKTDFWISELDTPRTLRPVDPDLTNPLEKPLARVKLQRTPPNRSDVLHIFRSDGNTLSLRRVQVSVDGSSKVIERTVFDLQNGIFVPMYTLPRETGFKIKTSGGWQEFHFDKRERALAFQSAFLGYRVCKQREIYNDIGIEITSAATVSRWRRGRDESKGEVQLWVWPQASRTSDTSRINVPSSIYSQASNASVPTMLSTIIQVDDQSIFKLKEGRNDETGAIWAELPHPPLLICFTKSKNFLTIWRVDLTGVEVTDEHQDENCITIRRKDEKKMDIHRLSVRHDRTDAWNLCAVAMVEHPDFGNQDVVEHVSGKYLVLRFPSSTLDRGSEKALIRSQEPIPEMSKRDTFNSALDIVLMSHRIDSHSLSEALNDVRRTQNRANYSTTSLQRNREFS